jgi:formylglycine-generating enzyme required for sulfatase activity
MAIFPALVTIPAGVLNGVAIASFQIGRTPVTNAEYAAHVDRYLNQPYVLLQTDPKTHATSVFCRGKTAEEAIGVIAKYLPITWIAGIRFCSGHSPSFS